MATLTMMYVRSRMLGAMSILFERRKDEEVISVDRKPLKFILSKILSFWKISLNKTAFNRTKPIPGGSAS